MGADGRGKRPSAPALQRPSPRPSAYSASSAHSSASATTSPRTLKRYLAQRATGVETSHVVLPLVRALKTGTAALVPAVERAPRYLATNAPRAHSKRDRGKGRSKLGLLPQSGFA
jgi:hypothetical protein